MATVLKEKPSDADDERELLNRIAAAAMERLRKHGHAVTEVQDIRRRQAAHQDSAAA